MDEGEDAPHIDYAYPRALVKSAAPPAGCRKIEGVYVAMRDGVRLCVDIYLPEAPGRYPALLSLSPYMQDIQRQPPHWSHAIESGATSFYVPKGYVHVIAQGRGGGRSQGAWRWFDAHERTDGYDLIEWVAAQDWCTGNVGMIGDSYWSWTQYHAAIAQPPHLKCVCQCDSSSDLYRDVCFQGGIFDFQFLGNWAQYVAAQTAWPGKVAGKKPAMNLHYEVIGHPFDGKWYRDRSAWPKLDRIKVPSMHIAPQGGALHFRGQLWAWPRIAAPKKLLVVPPTGFWSHVRYLTNRALNRQMLRWYDYWLKGIENGIMDEPPVAIFDSATRAWRHEAEYPLARTRFTSYYLRAGATGKATAPPYGTLATDAPATDEAPDTYRMPDSYAELTQGRPVVAFATPPLEADLRIWGPISLTLHASSSQIDTAFYAYLNDVPPPGADARMVALSRGILKASFRAVDEARSGPGQPFHPFDKMVLLEPGRTYEFRIELRPVFHTIRKGHRLELRIASEDTAYNNFQRQIDVQILPWPVENSIRHDPAHPSHLTLPVIPDAPEIAPVKSPIADIDWPLTPGSWMPNTDGWPLEGE